MSKQDKKKGMSLLKSKSDEKNFIPTLVLSGVSFMKNNGLAKRLIGLTKSIAHGCDGD